MLITGCQKEEEEEYGFGSAVLFFWGQTANIMAKSGAV